jgi:L-malate glycosyltransferase
MAENEVTRIRAALVAPSTRILGGQSVQAERLVAAFAADSEIELTLLPNNPESKYLKRLQGIPGFRTLITSLKFWSQLFQKVRLSDVVIISSSAWTGYLIGTLPPLFAAKFFGKNVILNYHSGDAEQHIKSGGWFIRSSMKEFDHIVVPSVFLQKAFEQFGLHAERIFNFVNAEDFPFRKRESFGPVFLANRNFEPLYNVAGVLRAFACIKQREPEARLVVAGSGRDEGALRRIAEELALRNIEFVGKRTQEQMAEHYRECDIYLNASLVDNMPLSIIEAFSCGVPVVSSNAGGIPFLIEHGETGMLSECADDRALAENALKLIQDNDLALKIVENASHECVKYRESSVCQKWRTLLTVR